MGTLGVQRYSYKLYNLDMIISVGYRVNSQRGIIFSFLVSTNILSFQQSVLGFFVKKEVLPSGKKMELNSKKIHFIIIMIGSIGSGKSYLIHTRTCVYDFNCGD